MEHYYTEKQTSAHQYGIVEAVLHGKKYGFLTDSGVFSPRKIDLGTRVLVENMVLGGSQRVLDIGCGYGPVGIVAADLLVDGYVVMSDTNARACYLSKRNIERNNVLNAEVRKGYGYEPVQGEVFDVILSNPPFTAGKKVVHDVFIKEALGHLSEGGSLQIVGRHNKGGAQAESKMEQVFGNVEQIAKQSGYRVYKGSLSKK